jgi:hypothetical protein
VRRHAKASTSGSTSGWDSRLTSLVHGVFATHGPSSAATGNGAPSHRVPSSHAFAFVLITATLIALAFAPISQAKVVVNIFGTPGLLGGQLNTRPGIAINRSGNGAPVGTVYVSDGNRIQRFSPSGAFERLWGVGVVKSGGTGDVGNGFEICTVPTDCTNGQAEGSGGRPGINSNGSYLAVAIDQATGNVYADAGNARIIEFDANGNFIRTWGWDVVKTGGTGNVSTNAFEICTVATDCITGDTGANGGQFSGDPNNLIVDASGNVWVPDSGNRRIQEFDSSGNFIAAYGYDVEALGGSGGLEKCTSTALGACQAGTPGSGAGQFSGSNPQDIAFDSSGNLYAIDPGNKRVQRFDSSLTTATDLGTSALFFSSILNPEGTPVTDRVPERITSTPDGSRLLFSMSKISGFIDHDSKPETPLQPSTERQILEVDPSDASVKDESLVGSGINTINGLYTSATGNLYATTPSSVLVFGAPLSDPVVAFDPITEKTDASANLTASVDPKGGLVTCKFEYSTDLTNWKDAEANGARGMGTVTGTATVSSVLAFQNSFQAGQKITSSDGGIPPNTTITAINGDTITLSQAATTSGPVTLTTPGCGVLSPGGGAQGINVNVGGLTPAAKYFVRMQTARPLVPNSTKTTTITSFETDSVPPVITDVGAVNIGDTSARMVATIDPRNSDTAYVFQYGTSPSLGSATAPLSIGAGTTPLTVSQVVDGLSKDTTYYFRAVATNLTGTTQSPSRTLHTRSAPLPLPENRRYEQVTPVDKNYGDASQGVIGIAPRAGVAQDGNAVGFCTAAQFGDPPGRMVGICSPYVNRRTPGGWQTPTSSLPPFCHVDPDSGDGDGLLGVYPSPDFSHVLFKRSDSVGCPLPFLVPDPPLNEKSVSYNFYRQDPTTDPFSYDVLNTQPSVPGSLGVHLAGGSDDYSHVVFKSKLNETPLPDSPPLGAFEKLYEWDNGTLRLVTKDPSNEPFEDDSIIPAVGPVQGASETASSAVSDDGERIYFANPAKNGGLNEQCLNPGCEIYMRESGTTTYDVSVSECTVECGSPQTMADYFLAATPSGEKAFFTSCARLTDDSSDDSGGCGGSGNPWGSTGGEPDSKLYRWDRGAPPGNRLVELTVDHEPSDGVRPASVGLVGASHDGDTAYFVTRNQIVAGGPTFAAVVGIRDLTNAKLYRWRWNGGSPSVEYLGPYEWLRPLGNSATGDYNLLQLHRQVSADGEYLVIYTKLALDPAVDRDSDADVYRWDEVNDWLCASCQLPGVPSRGDVELSSVELFNGTGFFEEIASVEPTSYMSQDGQRIFFATPDALVPEDVNGEVECPLVPELVAAFHQNVYTCEDVYEWHDGTVSLLSGGASDEPSLLIGSDLSGQNVFFFTRQQLVGWDLDDSVDIYDARIGGGFPEPPSAPPICEGEGCRGAGTAAPPTTGAGTTAFQGAANPETDTPERGCPKSKRKVRRNGKTRCVAKGKKHQSKRANHNRRTGR